MAISLRKLLEAAGDTLSAPQRNIGSLLSGDGLVDPYSDEADNYNPSELLVKGPGKLTGFGGFAADMLLDPLNLVGAGALGKMGAKAGMKAVEQTARQNAKAAIRQTVDNAMPMPRPQPVANPDARIAYMSKKLGPTDELTAQPSHNDIAQEASRIQKDIDLDNFHRKMFHERHKAKEAARSAAPAWGSFESELAKRSRYFDYKTTLDKQMPWSTLAKYSNMHTPERANQIRNELLQASEPSSLSTTARQFTDEPYANGGPWIFDDIHRKVAKPVYYNRGQWLDDMPQYLKQFSKSRNTNALLYGARKPQTQNSLEKLSKDYNYNMRASLLGERLHKLQGLHRNFETENAIAGTYGNLNKTSMDRFRLQFEEPPRRGTPWAKSANGINLNSRDFAVGNLAFDRNIIAKAIEDGTLPKEALAYLQSPNTRAARSQIKALLNRDANSSVRKSIIARPPLQSERSMNG